MHVYAAKQPQHKPKGTGQAHREAGRSARGYLSDAGGSAGDKQVPDAAANHSTAELQLRLPACTVFKCMNTKCSGFE